MIPLGTIVSALLFVAGMTFFCFMNEIYERSTLSPVVIIVILILLFSLSILAYTSTNGWVRDW